MEHNSYLLEEQLVFTVTADGDIDTAANTVDIAHHFGVRTDADRTLTLANPSINRNGWSAIVTNKGNFIITMYGIEIGPDEYARFIWDSNLWHSEAQKPSVVPCPDPMTRAALLALRNSSSLDPNCHYVITDYNRGTVGAAEIMLHAVDEETLSLDVEVKTTFDRIAWEGRYDIDTNRLTDLQDNLNNEVTGEVSVDTFPWGNTSVTDNTVNDGRITYTGGTVRGVTVDQNSTLTISGGSLLESSISGDSDLTITTGSNYELDVNNSSNVRQVGTGYLRRASFTNETTAVIGNVNINDSDFERSVFNTTGSTGSINYSNFRRFSGNAMQNVPSLTIDSCDYSSNSQMTITGATRVYLRYSSMQNYGRVLVSAGATLNSQYTGMRDYSYIQVLRGVLTANYCSLSGVSYIQHNTTGTNAMDSTTIKSRANARFLGTSTGCRIHYSTISSGSTIYHTGTSTGCYFYYNDVSSSSQMYTNNSVNLRGYYNTVAGNSQYYSQNVTGTHYAYYNSLNGHGYIRHINGSGGRIYAVSCHGQGLLQLNGATDAGRIYYSSFTAYYYLYANNWTITRTSLHGYGRRTYTVTNPAANGTFTQNF